MRLDDMPTHAQLYIDSKTYSYDRLLNKSKKSQ